MQDTFYDCCLRIISSDNQTFEVFGFRQTWQKFGYLKSLFRFAEPDKIVVAKPTFYLQYHVQIPFERHVVERLLLEQSVDVSDYANFVHAQIFFDANLEDIKNFLNLNVENLSMNSETMKQFLLKSIDFGLDLKVIQNLVGRYYSLFDKSQVEELQLILRETMPLDVCDIALHNTQKDNILFIVGNQPKVIFKNMQFQVYSTSVIDDNEAQSGFWFTCYPKDHTETPSYEQCVESNRQPKMFATITFHIYDVCLDEPKHITVRNSRTRSKVFNLPCDYKYTTIERYGEIVYKDLENPVFYAIVQFLE